MPIEIIELIGDPGDSEESSDSDQSISEDVAPPPRLRQRSGGKERRELSLDEAIQEINKLLDQGKSPNLSDPKYPKLFVGNYRGINYFEQYFPQEKRRETRQKIKQNKLKEPICAPALYELAELSLGQAIDKSAEVRLKKAKGKLEKELTKLHQQKVEFVLPSKKMNADLTYETTQFNKYYQRYVNRYERFREESEEQQVAPYTALTSTKNPFLSTSEEPRHAVLYALGGKSELSHGTCRPNYYTKGDDALRAKHPKVGHVYIILHSLQELAESNPVFLSPLHAARKVDIDTRQLNERETTFIGYISPENIVHTEQVRFPSFNVSFSRHYHAPKYGLVQRGFTKYKKNIASKRGSTNLLDNLAAHYAEKLQQKAESIAAERGGFLVYLDINGRLRKSLPPTIEITSNRKNVGKKTDDTYQQFTENLNRYKQSKRKNTDMEGECEELMEVESDETVINGKDEGYAIDPLTSASSPLSQEKPGIPVKKRKTYEDYAISSNSVSKPAPISTRSELNPTLVDKIKDEEMRRSLYPELNAFVENLAAYKHLLSSSTALGQAHKLYIQYKEANALLKTALLKAKEYLQKRSRKNDYESADQFVKALADVCAPSDPVLRDIQIHSANLIYAQKRYNNHLISQPVVIEYIEGCTNAALNSIFKVGDNIKQLMKDCHDVAQKIDSQPSPATIALPRQEAESKQLSQPEKIEPGSRQTYNSSNNLPQTKIGFFTAGPSEFSPVLSPESSQIQQASQSGAKPLPQATTAITPPTQPAPEQLPAQRAAGNSKNALKTFSQLFKRPADNSGPPKIKKTRRKYVKPTESIEKYLVRR